MVRTPRLQLGNAVVTRRYGRRRSSYRLGEGRSEANDSVDAVICGSKDLRRSLCVMRCSANLLARTSRSATKRQFSQMNVPQQGIGLTYVGTKRTRYSR